MPANTGVPPRMSGDREMGESMVKDYPRCRPVAMLRANTKCGASRSNGNGSTCPGYSPFAVDAGSHPVGVRFGYSSDSVSVRRPGRRVPRGQCAGFGGVDRVGFTVGPNTTPAPGTPSPDPIHVSGFNASSPRLARHRRKTAPHTASSQARAVSGRRFTPGNRPRREPRPRRSDRRYFFPRLAPPPRCVNRTASATRSRYRSTIPYPASAVRVCMR